MASAASGVALGVLAACVGEEPPVVISSATPTDDAGPPPGAGDDAGSSPAEGADVDAGKDAADGPARFCATQAAGAGVKDFFCADFDGTDLLEGFTTINVPDGGALVRVSDVAYSAPSSLATQGNATVAWENAGAVNFSEVEVAAQVNVGKLSGTPPNTDGSMTILELEVGNTKTALAYTRGALVEDVPDYAGYFLYSMRCTPCSSTVKRVPSLPANVWSSLRLRWTSAGTVGLWIDGTQAFDGSLLGATGPKVAVRIGLKAVGSAPATPRHAFDDVMISVKR